MLKATAPTTSQPVYDIRYLYEQSIPMRDGIRLSADVDLPRSNRPFPVFLFRTPTRTARAVSIMGALLGEAGLCRCDTGLPAPDTVFTVNLVDVFPNGYGMKISEGILRARYRHDDASPELLERGEPDEFRIRMYPTSHVFRTNHRIRADVLSSKFPRFSRNLNTGEAVATGTRLQIAQQTVVQ